MDGYLPIKPGGSSFAIAGAPSASSALKVDGPSEGEVVYLFDNSNNTARAWIGYGMSSTAAQNNAVIPLLSGAGTQAIPIAGGSVQTFTLSPNLFLSAIMEMGSGTIIGMTGFGC